MSASGSTQASQRTLRFVVIGAVIGALVGLVAFLAKVAIADNGDYGANWLWSLMIVLGAIAGAALGLVSSALGQDADT
jgi:hypothetical protein